MVSVPAAKTMDSYYDHPHCQNALFMVQSLMDLPFHGRVCRLSSILTVDVHGGYGVEPYGS